MCGICFIYDAGAESDHHEAIRRMTASLAHRGPDTHQVLLRKYAAMGHTRLSIVDIKAGNQPMLSDDGRYCIVYNGEIFNYRVLKKNLQQKGLFFRTVSDTEVILKLYQAYGKDCVSYLRGMFSFAIHDNTNGRIFIARDRLGIKPLYYFWGDKYLVGASEIKAIFASHYVEPVLNLDSIVNYFKYQFSIAPFTPFENIIELEPGFTLSLEPGGLPQLSRYWELEFPREDEYESLEEQVWINAFRETLDETVQTHLIGEVPIGAYLSGGIDSATATFLLKKHYQNKVRSFTIGFSNQASDESDIARAIAEHIPVEYTQMLIKDSKPDGFVTDLINAIYHLEQPQRAAVDIPYFMLSDFVHRNNYKVVFTGDGADEILAGYDCFRQDMIRMRGNGKSNQQDRESYYLQELTAHFARQHMQMLMQLHQPAQQQQTIEAFGCYPVWFDTWQILNDITENIFTEGVIHRTGDNRQMEMLQERMKPQIEKRHYINQSLYIESKTRLPGWILWKSDRLSMAHGVEARLPFMDHKLVELSARVPPDLKLKGMDEKYILKQIMRDNLPVHPQQFKKRAFYTPIREWFFTTEKIPQLDRYLSKAALDKTGIFNSSQVELLIENIKAMPVAKTNDDYFTLMKLEWSLMLVLTVQILHWLFIEKQAPCFSIKT